MDNLGYSAPRQRITKRALGVWGAAVVAYVAAVAGRTSLGVAGVEAMDRFGVDASRIATFTALQVAVYALAQIPVGVLIDRHGARIILVVGAFMMGVGQIILALTTSFPTALAARALIGAGDATAFLSVLRLLPFWFPPRITPLFTQLTASVGQLGQFISAVPFLYLLHATGWQTSFLSLGGFGILIGILAAVVVADSHEEPTTVDSLVTRPRVGASLRDVGRRAVCWQAMFIHSVGLTGLAVFTLLWGVPLMTLGMGLAPTEVGLILTLSTVALVVASPFAGVVSARVGDHRDSAALVGSAVMIAAWVVFFASAEPRGFGAVLGINLVMAVLSPVANFGFDNVRAKVPRTLVATGTGMANMGGFLSTMVGALGIGLVLDVSSPTGEYSWTDFQLAWLVIGALWVCAAVGIIWTRRLLNRAR